MSRILMSSMNFPRPRRRRFSSFRGMERPTQPAVVVVLTIASFPCFLLLQGFLQAVNQSLNLLFAQGFEQSACNRGQSAEDLSFTLPAYASSGGGRGKIECCDHG